MKKLFFTTTILLSISGTAQFKIPSKGDLEKRAKKEVKQATDGKKDEPKTTDNNTSNTTEIPVEETQSPAKAQINNFWKHIEKMRTHSKEDNKQVVFSNGLQAARTALSNTKMKDANYNTTEMEKALKECEDVYNGLSSGKEDLRDLRAKTLNSLLMFFDYHQRNFITYNYSNAEPDNEKLARVKRNDDSITRYKQLAQDFVTQKKDELYYKNHLSTVKNLAKSYQEPTDKNKYPGGLANPMFHLFDPTSLLSYGSFTFVQDVKQQEAMFYAATIIYPNEPDLIKAYDWCKKAVAELGTTDQFLAKINKSQNDYLKSVKIPAPKVNDASLEATFIKLYNATGNKEKILKVSIQSTDWTVERNELTGIVTGRSKMAVMVTKGADGNCYFTNFWITQDYNGSGYGQYYGLKGSSGSGQLACENVK